MCKGRVIKVGSIFIIAPLQEIRKRKIKLHKTEELVIIEGDYKPVWEKENWDECPKIDRLFEEMRPPEYKLEDFLVENLIQRDLMGIGGIGL